MENITLSSHLRAQFALYQTYKGVEDITDVIERQLAYLLYPTL